ncbi:MAG: efflux RND transporter periplasmic adaptor subunit [Campylobacteraceae bacterium]|jgi:membrane fusion protein (multidrug efflux system)|nr:efflux RND transporter periplasmic adaptor subunit [Campylobacteraceae bacterium]
MRSHKFLLSKYSVAVFVCLFFITGCDKGADAGQSAAGAVVMPPLPVNTFTAQKRDVPINLEYPARIKSVQQVQVVARVPGTLEKKFFKEGSFVTEGTLLYQIDPAKYQAAYDVAKAQGLVADAAFKQAERNWRRSEKLYEKNAVSQREYDQALSGYETAKAQVEAAKAALSNAKVDLDYTKIRATASGNIGQNMQDLGSYVGTAASNSILTTITQTNPVYAEFSLPDIELLKKRYTLARGSWKNIINARLPVKIFTPAGESYNKLGVFDFLDNLVDPQTATIKARATFDNKDGVLIPGLFVRVSIEGLVQRDVFAIPQKAVLQDTMGTYVYIVKENKAKKTYVITENTVENSEIIIKSGLKDGDEIILDNLTKIRDDADIAPIPKAK